MPLRRVRVHVLLLLFTGLVGLFAARDAAGQPPPVVADPATETTADVDALGPAGRATPPNSTKAITPLVAPVPFHDSQLGWGLALMVGAIHRFDPDTTYKPSTGAVGGFYSENKSWGVFALEAARLAQDRWRLRGIYGHMDLRYDFYGIGEDAGDAGLSVPLGQTIDVAAATALRRIAPGLYVGGGIVWMSSDLRFRGDAPSGLPPPDPDAASGQLFAPGLQAEFDTRNDDYWPTGGSLANFKGWFFLDALGATREFQRYAGAWSWYTRLDGERLILATNVNFAAAQGDAPFYLLPTIGGGQFGLRGYTQGRYRDEVMTTVQAEFRFHSAGRFGATVFGGFGQVAPAFGDLDDAAILPAGGAGLRYKLTRKFPLHMRLDYAWGKGDEILYFSVSEAF